MEKPEKLTVEFRLKPSGNYFVRSIEYPFIYAEGLTLNAAFDRFIEFLKNDGVYDDGVPIYVKEKSFDNIINMGTGYNVDTKIGLLKARLNYAINIVGGLQQPHRPDHETTEEEDKQYEELRKNLETDVKDVIKDIAAALGYSVTIKKQK